MNLQHSKYFFCGSSSKCLLLLVCPFGENRWFTLFSLTSSHGILTQVNMLIGDMKMLICDAMESLSSSREVLPIYQLKENRKEMTYGLPCTSVFLCHHGLMVHCVPCNNFLVCPRYPREASRGQ